MKLNTLIKAAAASSVIALGGCDIDKTQDGELPDVDVRADAGQLPKYDVEVTKTQDGRLPDVDVDVDGGKLPKYKVRGPDIDIGTQQAKIKVPDVDVKMEEKTITLPDIDIDLPDEDGDS